MKTLRQRNIRDYIMVSLLVLSTVLVLTPLLIIIGYVIVNGLGAISIDFFTQELGSPARAMQGQPTGLAHTIIGTFVVDTIGLIIAVPVGVGAGIMLSEYPEHKLNPLLRVLNDTLNGMPAILKGLLAFALIVRPMGTFSGLSGGVALAFVMIPIIARATESALMTIPWSIREAGLAIGLPRWRVVLSTIVPAARIGLVTGFLIAFARAAGEAAPLMFTSFGNNYLPNHWTGMILGPVDTLPQRLYSLAISPYAEWHTMGWAAGIVLLVFVVVLFAGAQLLTRKQAL
jgi:phosphate transport system permease protein